MGVVISAVTSYIVMRERILKTELKYEQLKQYIDGQYRLIDSKIIEIQKDIIDFKDLNKELTKSLNDTAGAMEKLSGILEILKDDLVYIKQKM